MAEETTPKKTTAKKTTESSKEVFCDSYYKALKIPQAKNGDKKRTGLNGEPIN